MAITRPDPQIADRVDDGDRAGLDTVVASICWTTAGPLDARIGGQASRAIDRRLEPGAVGEQTGRRRGPRPACARRAGADQQARRAECRRPTTEVTRFTTTARISGRRTWKRAK